MLNKIILLFLTILLVGCGEPLTDEMVNAVGESCKQHNMILKVDNFNKLAECEKED